MAHLRHGQGRRLPGRPGRRRDHVRRRPSTPSSTWRRWACRSTARPRAGSTSAASAATPATTARPPVRRSCYAADRTGHMILQTLYQNCVKHGVEFFNEFYVLDLLIDRGRRRRSGRGRRRLRARHRRDPRLPGQVRRSSPPAASARSSRPPPTRTPSPVTAWASSTAAGCRWRTWSSSSSTRPASGRPGHPALRGAPAARAASCATRTASASWSATPRPSRTSRRATSSPAPWLHGGPRGPRLRPEQGLRPASTSPTSSRRSIDAKLPDITEFARTYLGVEPYTEPVPDPARPRTTRWAASRPTSRPRCSATTTTVVPGLYAAGEVACVSRARRQPPRHQLAARHQRLRPARRHRRRRVRRDAPTASTCPRTRAAQRRRRMLERLRDAARHASGSPRSARSCRRRWTRNVQVFRTEETLKQALETTSRRCKERYRERRRPGQGQALQHRPARGRRAGLPARPGRGASSSRALARNESRGGHFREDYPNRDDVNFMRHTMAYRRGRRRTATEPSASTTSRSSMTRYQPMERKY